MPSLMHSMINRVTKGTKHLHGVAATYTRNSDASTTAITIIPGAEADTRTPEDDGQADILTRVAVIEAADLSFTISLDDRLTIDGDVWNIKDIAADGNGLTQVLLVRRVSIESSVEGHRLRSFD